MFCRTCGKKIKDDAAFCPFCGCATGLVSSAAPVQASASEQTQAGLEGQVSAARKRSRRKMPMVLIVILVVFGIATAAFAANYIYKTFIVPQMEAAAPDESVAEPTQTTYTIESFSGDKYVGAPPELKGTTTTPAFAFDLPDGWEVVNDVSLDSGGPFAGESGFQRRVVLIVNRDLEITLSLSIELGSSFSGLMFDGNDLISCASSGLGSDYAVGYYAKQLYGQWDGFFGLCKLGTGLPGIVFGDMDYTVYFKLLMNGSNYSDSAIGEFWSTFNINDPKWADVISIISSLRYA